MRSTLSEVGGVSTAAFLDLIAWAEDTSNGLDEGYGVIVTGHSGPSTFTDYSQHPFGPGGRPPVLVTPTPLVQSTAAGRYQIIYYTYAQFAPDLKITDFEPVSQDKLAIALIKSRGALGFVQAGNPTNAIPLVANIWPGLQEKEDLAIWEQYHNFFYIWQEKEKAEAAKASEPASHPDDAANAPTEHPEQTDNSEPVEVTTHPSDEPTTQEYGEDKPAEGTIY